MLYTFYDMFSKKARLSTVAEYFTAQGFDIVNTIKIDKEFSNMLMLQLKMMSHILSINETQFLQFRYRKPDVIEQKLLKINDHIDCLISIQDRMNMYYLKCMNR